MTKTLQDQLNKELEDNFKAGLNLGKLCERQRIGREVARQIGFARESTLFKDEIVFVLGSLELIFATITDTMTHSPQYFAALQEYSPVIELKTNDSLVESEIEDFG